MTDDGGKEWWAQVMAAFGQGDVATAQMLVLQGMQKDPSWAVNDGRHVGVAHILILAAHWGLVDSLLPAGTNFFRTSGWLESLRRNKPVNLAGEPLPWLTYPAIDFLEHRIRPKWSILEWGCGSSTLWWSTRVSRVRSIENDANWHRMVSESKPGNCNVELATTEEAYVGALAGGGPYDVLVIDGEWRNQCAVVAANHGAKLIVFDNTDAAGFDEGAATLTAAGWQRIDFFGLIPSYAYKNCTSLFYKDPALLQTDKRPAGMKLSSGLTCAHSMDATRRDLKAAAAAGRPAAP